MTLKPLHKSAHRVAARSHLIPSRVSSKKRPREKVKCASHPTVFPPQGGRSGAAPVQQRRGGAVSRCAAAFRADDDK